MKVLKCNVNKAKLKYFYAMIHVKPSEKGLIFGYSSTF